MSSLECMVGHRRMAWRRTVAVLVLTVLVPGAVSTGVGADVKIVPVFPGTPLLPVPFAPCTLHLAPCTLHLLLTG